MKTSFVRRAGALALVMALAGVVASCANPVPDGEIAALGGEAPNVDPGPNHRAGQPCVLCHSDTGPASDHVFSVAGTIFQSQAMAIGVNGTEILLVDSTGSSPKDPVFTNAVGNFYITPDQWAPAFPILAGIYNDGTSVTPPVPPARRSMQSHISREPSCGFCHKDPVSAGEALSAVGHIYLN
jgi:hypothetical protein